MTKGQPRLVIASLRGSSGKTVITIGLVASLRQMGASVAVFKKGPDYIDPAWHSLASGRPCRNLDTFLMTEGTILSSFLRHSDGADVAIIEGNRGLYDGVDADGTHSTAELSVLLRAPVLLVVDCTKVTRTAAALVRGCQEFDQRVDIAGVILNQVAGKRHETVLRRSIEHYCRIPVLGAIPRLEKPLFSERHLGLLPPQEHPAAAEAVSDAADTLRQHVNSEDMRRLAEGAPSLKRSARDKPLPSTDSREHMSVVRQVVSPEGLRVGVIRDSAFQFYYPENIEALSACGGNVVEVSAIADSVLPEVDALYIGGGFPETHAEALAENLGFKKSLRDAIEGGLPTFAECGGLIYLGETLSIRGKAYPMVGVLPIKFGFRRRPRAHGYTELEATAANPYFAKGRLLRGHEFRYSTVLSCRDERLRFTFNVRRGRGFDGKRDGVCYKNVLATYSHFHALSVEDWASALLSHARQRAGNRAGAQL